jgi:hypothetical protein
MLFPEDGLCVVELYDGAWENTCEKKKPLKEKCPRCGSGPEKKDRGVCKGDHLNPDGRKSLCFLRW